MTFERPKERHLLDEITAAHLVAAHVLHIGNHNYNQTVCEMRRVSEEVNFDPLVREHEALWDRLNLEVGGIHSLIWLSRMLKKPDPQLFDRYDSVQELLEKVHAISDKLVEKYGEHASDAVKENLRLGKEVHKTLVKVIYEHGIVKDYHLTKPVEAT